MSGDPNDIEMEKDDLQENAENLLIQDPVTLGTIQEESSVLANPVPQILDSPILDGQILDGPILDGPILDSPILDAPILDPQILEPQVAEGNSEEPSTIGENDHFESDQSVPNTEVEVVDSNPLTIGSSEVGESPQIQNEENLLQNPLPGKEVIDKLNSWSYLSLSLQVEANSLEFNQSIVSSHTTVMSSNLDAVNLSK